MNELLASNFRKSNNNTQEERECYWTDWPASASFSTKQLIVRTRVELSGLTVSNVSFKIKQLIVRTRALLSGLNISSISWITRLFGMKMRTKQDVFPVWAISKSIRPNSEVILMIHFIILRGLRMRRKSLLSSFKQRTFMISFVESYPIFLGESCLCHSMTRHPQTIHLNTVFLKDLVLDSFFSLFIPPLTSTSSIPIYLISIAMQMILNYIYPSNQSH